MTKKARKATPDPVEQAEARDAVAREAKVPARSPDQPAYRSSPAPDVPIAPLPERHFPSEPPPLVPADHPRDPAPGTPVDRPGEPEAEVPEGLPVDPPAVKPPPPVAPLREEAAAEPGPPAPPSPAVYVYLPDDEGDVVIFNGDGVAIGPGTTEIKARGVHTARVVAEHVAAKLRDWGACVISSPVTDGRAGEASDQAAVDEAKRRYLARTQKWAQDIVREAYERDKPSLDAGIKVKETPAVKEAKAWLADHESELREAKLAD